MTDTEIIAALSEPQFPPELWSAVDTLAETVLRISDERHDASDEFLRRAVEALRQQ